MCVYEYVKTYAVGNWRDTNVSHVAYSRYFVQSTKLRLKIQYIVTGTDEYLF